MRDEQRKMILDILDKTVDLTIATNRPDGWPQATTVSFVNDGLTLYFGTGADSQKVANIGRDGRVSVTVDAPYDSWRNIRSLSMAGTAAVVSEPAELARVGDLMMKRFGEELAKLAAPDMAETRFVRVRPKLISILDYSKDFGHTEEVAVGTTSKAA
jgi:PPOX class probable F420-dependent enzyme